MVRKSDELVLDSQASKKKKEQYTRKRTPALPRRRNEIKWMWSVKKTGIRKSRGSNAHGDTRRLRAQSRKQKAVAAQS